MHRKDMRQLLKQHFRARLRLSNPTQVLSCLWALVRGSPSPARKRILLSSQCAESASWWPLAVVQLGRDNGFLAVEDVLDQGYVIVAAAGYTTCATYSATGVDYYVELHVGEREHLDHAL